MTTQLRVLSIAAILAVNCLTGVASHSQTVPPEATSSTPQTKQLEAPNLPTVSKSGNSSDVSELQAARQQVRVLEAQLQAHRDFQSSVLDTIYWALGGVFLLLGVIVGVGWWSNFKVYERDKESMREGLAAEVSLKVAAVEASLRDNLEKATDTKFKNLQDVLANATAGLSYEQKAQSKRIFELEMRHVKSIMEAQTDPGMALSKALTALRHCAAQAENEVPDLIKFILAKLDQGGRFTASEIAMANEVIDALPTKYGTLTAKLRQKLVDSEIF